MENVYQAAKTDGDRSQFITCSPSDPKHLGQSASLRQKWDIERVSVMFRLLDQKFAFGSALAEKLTSTGEVELIEGNDWGDTFWGVRDGQATSHLGRALMTIRYLHAHHEMINGQPIGSD